MIYFDISTESFIFDKNKYRYEHQNCVSGIGGVGGYYGGKLAGYYKEDENVKIYFISRGENMRTIQRQGLKIQTLHHQKLIYPRQIIDQPGGKSDIRWITYLYN